MLSTLRKFLLEEDLLKYFSNLSRKRHFDTSFKSSPMDGDNLHEMSYTVFLENEKNITNLWSAEFAQRATKISGIFEHFIHQHLNTVYVFCLVTKCGHITSSTAKGQTGCQQS